MRRLPPYFNNRLKCLIKTPKVQFLDSGVLASLTGATAKRIRADRRLFGPVLEPFLYAELLKHPGVSHEDYSPMHYRYRDQTEVDFVIERSDSRFLFTGGRSVRRMGNRLHAVSISSYWGSPAVGHHNS